MNTRSTCFTPEMVLSSTGQNAAHTMIAIFDDSPMPRNSMNTGKQRERGHLAQQLIERIDDAFGAAKPSQRKARHDAARDRQQQAADASAARSRRDASTLRRYRTGARSRRATCDGGLRYAGLTMPSAAALPTAAQKTIERDANARTRTETFMPRPRLALRATSALRADQHGQLCSRSLARPLLMPPSVFRLRSSRGAPRASSEFHRSGSPTRAAAARRTRRCVVSMRDADAADRHR